MKIGVLGNEGSWYVDELCRSGRALGHSVLPLVFPLLTAHNCRDRLQISCGEESLHELDAIIVRTMPPGSLERIVTRMDLLCGLEKEGVRIINTPRAIECAVDKWLTTQKLIQAGIPVPETAICEDSDAAIRLCEQLGGDVVVKPLFGSEGRGIIRVDSPDLAWRVFRSLERTGAVMYLQRFIPGVHGDYRILLLDGRVVGAMKRMASAHDFRTNAAQSGICTPWTPNEYEVEIAIRAAAATDCIFCGVDIIYDADGQLKVLEVNAVPGWKALQKTCDVCIPSILFNWIAQG
jgi:RimK family alpha-L-glutamate ligase